MSFLKTIKQIIQFDRLVVGGKTDPHLQPEENEQNSNTTITLTDDDCWYGDYSTLKVSELKSLAKERGLKGYSSLKKAQLIELLSK